MSKSPAASITRITNEGLLVLDQYTGSHGATEYGPDGYFVNWEGPKLKSELRHALPKYVRSSHLTEAIAACFDFKSQAALLSAIGANPHLMAWPSKEKLYRRLENLAHAAGEPFDDVRWRTVSHIIENVFCQRRPGRPTWSFDLIANLKSPRSVPQDNLETIRKAVVDRRHILIFGRWGSGRTTLLEMLSDLIGQRDEITSVEVWSEVNFRLGRNLTAISTSLNNPERRPTGWPRDLEIDGQLLLVDDLHDEEAKLSVDALRAARSANGSIMTMTHYANNTEGSVEGVVRRLKEWSEGVSATTNMILHLDHGRERPWIDACWNLSRDWRLDRVW
jgi:hypothetical protein